MAVSGTLRRMPGRNEIRKAATCLAAALLAAALISIVFSTGFYSHIQVRLSDFLHGGRQPLDSIAIIEIDDKSIQEIGRWPWERGNFTALIGELPQAKAVGLDVGFFEASDHAADAALAAAVKKAGNIVMPAEYTRFSSTGSGVRAEEMIVPVSPLKESAASIGYINVITDKDGITRAVDFSIDGDYQPFAYEVLKLFMKKGAARENRLLINYAGEPGIYPHYSFKDVIDGKYNKAEFKDKIVLVGATAADLHDTYFVPTSLGKAMPGVEIHANIIQQLATGKYLHNAAPWLTILSIFTAAVIVALAVLLLPVWLSSLVSAGLFVAYTFITIFVFNAGIILNIIYIPVTIVLTYTATMIYFYISEKHQRKKVLGALEKYVSKDVISHILAHPDRLKLGGERREITIFFSDIRGFTTISEKLSPEELVRLLNEYLTEMTNIILKYNGVVDKYMGDAIMAFWGAPIDQPRHAELACSASLQMEKRLKELQKKWTKQGVPPLEIGIGLNTGFAVIGNMGSYERFDYTAMGDTVNLGSRLEGLNKQYGTRIIISETTWQKIEKKGFTARKLDRVMVKGKKEPITIYELVSAKGNTEKWQADIITHFEKGLSLYFRQKFDEAAAEFEKADRIKAKATGSADGPSGGFKERCEYFRKHAPEKEWDGVCVMKTK
jgi:adenylate cyclase